MRFIAECPMQSEVIRLSVYGGGEEGYLGVPLPEGGVLKLDKKLSPFAMKSFPKSIDHCALAGEKPEDTQPEETVEEAHEEKAEEAAVETAEDNTFWYASSDGALVSRSGEREMVALPTGDARLPRDIPGQPRIIEGKEYLVYITKEM